MRVGVGEFSGDSIVGNTIWKFGDYMGRVVITVDSVDVGGGGGIEGNLQRIRK